MNLSRRLIIQFIIQHLFVLFTLLIAVIVAFAYLGHLFSTTLYDSNVPEFDNFTISQYISSENGRVTLSSEIKEIVEKKNDWLQVVDENGNVLYDFNTPEDVPGSYTKTSLVAYLQHHIQSPYKFTYWDIEVKEKPAIVIYGGKLKSNTILQNLKEKHASPLSATFALTEQEKNNLQQMVPYCKYLVQKEKKFLLIRKQNESPFQLFKLSFLKKSLGIIKKISQVFIIQKIKPYLL